MRALGMDMTGVLGGPHTEREARRGKAPVVAQLERCGESLAGRLGAERMAGDGRRWRLGTRETG